MKKPFLCSLFLVLAWQGCEDSPQESINPAEYFYRSAKGSEYTYEVITYNLNGSERTRISGDTVKYQIGQLADTIKNGAVVTELKEYQKNLDYAIGHDFVANTDGIYEWTREGSSDFFRYYALKAPVEVGKSYNTFDSPYYTLWKSTIDSIGIPCLVPAGSFDAIKVSTTADTVWDDKKSHLRIATLYAKGHYKVYEETEQVTNFTFIDSNYHRLRTFSLISVVER